MLEAVGFTGVYVLIGVTLVVAFLLGLVLFASKEQTFEDVVAAQKKEQEALLNALQSSSKSKKTNKKWTKSKNKKENKKRSEDHEGVEVDSGVDDDEPSCESVSIPPEKLEEHGKKNTSKKNKKGELTEEAIPDTTTEDVKKPKQEKSKKQKKPKKVIEEIVAVTEVTPFEAGKSGPEEEVIIVAEEEVTVSSEPPLPPPPSESSQKKNKTGKKKTPKTEPENPKEGAPTARKLVNDIQNAQLGSAELQEVIDSLLAKQNENEQWKKPNQKGDPVEQLKKQISEMDIQLMEERKNAQSMAHKNKDLRLELQQERHQKQALQTQVGNRLTQQAKENETMRKRMEEQHLSEMQSTQTQIHRLQQLIDEASHLELQRLKDENGHATMRAQQLSEDKKSLMNELTQLQQGNKQLRQDLDNSRMQYQQVEKQMQNAQRAKSESENALSQRLQEVNDQLLKVDAQNRTLTHELQQTKSENQKAKVDLESLQQSAPVVSAESPKLEETQAKLSDTEEKLSKAQAKLNESDSSLSDIRAELQNKEKELKKLQSDLHDAHKSLSAKETDVTSASNLAAEKNKRIEELTKEVEVLQKEIKEVKNTSAKPNNDDSAAKNTISKLESELQEAKDKLSKMEESLDGLKIKNNELREKNWKAVDALSKSEESSNKKNKQIEIELMKGFKRLHPGIKIPTFDSADLNKFFESYEINLQNSSDPKVEELVKENKQLLKDLEDARKVTKKSEGGDNDEMEKLKTDNTHLKSVLADTESMLSRLQVGVDAEVAKWQKKVDEKDSELEDASKKISELEEVLKEHGFEKKEVSQEHIDTTPSKKKKHGFSYTLTKIIHPKMEQNLKETQLELEKEKTKNQKLQESLELAEKNLNESSNKELEDELKTIKEQLQLVKKQLGDKHSSSESEVNELNTKLKKTISERDLLIREYKQLKEKSGNSGADLKQLNSNHEKERKELSEVHTKELKKLKDQLTALENTNKTSGKSDKEKDKLIGKLYLEIEELKEDLREERDRVIVDIETPDAEELHRQVESLTEEKFNLSLKLNDLERSFQEEQSDKDKLLILESKLKASEAKVQELESAQIQQIENQIDDAMQQALGSNSNIGTSV